jgi:hypothetical protein
LASLYRSGLKCGPVLEKLEIQLVALEVILGDFFGKLLKKAKAAVDGANISTMSTIRFPVSDHAEIASYLLPIPRRLLDDALPHPQCHYHSTSAETQ